MEWHIIVYRILNLLLVITFILGFFALPKNDNKDREEIMDIVHRVIIIFLGLTLTMVFNPFYPVKLNPFYREIAFSSGVFILTTSSLFLVIDKILPKKFKGVAEFTGREIDYIETTDRVIKGTFGDLIDFS
jgi:hypothetical protein